MQKLMVAKRLIREPQGSPCPLLQNMKATDKGGVMKQIFITLVINVEETFDDYKDVHPDIIMGDLLEGELIKQCTMVDVVIEE